MTKQPISRRTFFRAGLWGASGLAGAAALARVSGLAPEAHAGHGLPVVHAPEMSGVHGSADGVVGDVDTSQFDPMQFLTHFDYGEASTENGAPVRTWNIVAVNKEIEVAPGVFFPGWAYDGQVPGRTFRATEGDQLRFHFRNGSDHPHTIHFHGIHPPGMDGITPLVNPGEEFTYEFVARPFGLHLYHCHTMPLKRHIHKGLYGAFIIDPPGGRAPAHEMVMVMNAFDTNFDGENEVYAVNTVAFHYAKHPIPVKVGELNRIYLVNLTEFDPINSFHLHASMYRVYRTGTQLDRYDYTDTVMMCQGERHVLEFTLDYPGQYMFHAHQSELAELGWVGMFEATE
jgi:FtsP/CotA-like multicopper oxidase with cupredoxin domain